MSYQIVRSSASAQHIKLYSKLLSNVFKNPSKFTEEYLSWLYAQNPNGTLVGTDAFFEGELVAHYATIPISYTFFGQRVRGLLAINNVTHPEHQHKGLFLKLGTETMEEAKRLGYEFVFAVTNNNSTYGYLNKFDFTRIAPLDVKIGCGVMVPSKAHANVFSNWDDACIRWRFQSPKTPYFRHNRSVYSKTEIIGLNAQIISCNVNSINELDLAEHRSVFTMWIGLSNTLKRKGLFVDMPDRVKPSPLNLLYRDLTGNLPIFSKDDLVFELADFDAY